MSVIDFPKGAVDEAVDNLVKSSTAKRVKAVVIISLEDDSIRVRHGWGDNAITALEMLALAAGVEHSKLVIFDELES